MRKTITMIICFFLIGCSTRANLKIINPTGRDLPSPHYVLKSMQRNLVATFYYISLSKVQDIDGTMIPKPKYIPLHKVYTTEPATELMLIIEISNPERIEYKLWKEVSIEDKNGHTEMGAELAKSNLEYRQFVLSMPNNSEIKEVFYNVKIYENKSERPLMYLGNFHYKIKGKEVVSDNCEVIF